MANTYAAIAKQVLTGNQTSVTFNSIPQGFTDLVLQISTRSTSTSATYDAIYVQFNSLSNVYSYTELFGYTTGVLSSHDQYGSTKGFLGWYGTATTTTNTFSSGEIYIPNYTSSIYKTISITSVTQNNATTSEAVYLTTASELLSSTDAINSLTLSLFSAGSFVSNSRFDLYGIKNN